MSDIERWQITYAEWYEGRASSIEVGTALLEAIERVEDLEAELKEAREMITAWEAHFMNPGSEAPPLRFEEVLEK